MSNKRLVIISGGAGGIGTSLSTLFCQQGYAVAIGYSNNRQKAEELALQLNIQGAKALAVAMDYSCRDSIKKAIAKVTEHFLQPVSILINNGALAQEKQFETITDDDWERMLKVNLQGPFIAVQETLNDMKQQQWGRVINITSISGQWGGFNQVHYAASKAGLINFTQSISKIYSKDGIASMAIAIGLVATDMSAKELASEAGKDKVRNIPAGRLACADEVAKQVLHLCQDDSFYLTGQTINMNGGMYFG